MSVIALKNYLMAQHTAVTLAEIANFLTVDPDTARGMLDIWIRKGKVISHEAAKCKNCSSDSCKSRSTIEVFQWHD